MTSSGGAVQIEALDGFALGASLHPARPSRGVALIVSGAMAVPQTYYGDFAGAAAARGFDVVTYDYRGIGASRPAAHAGSLRGFRAAASDWMRLDFEGVHRWVRRELEPQRVAVVGHSFGGNAFGLAPSAHCIDGGVFVAAQSGYWRHWAAPRRYLYAALWHGVVTELSRQERHAMANYARFGVFLDQTSTKYIVGLPANQSFGRDSLMREQQRLVIEGLLKHLSGVSLTLQCELRKDLPDPAVP